MQFDQIISLALIVVAGYFALIALTTLLRPIVFIFEPLFSWVNRFQWFIQNPLRFAWRKSQTSTSRGTFLFLTLTGLTAIWWIVSYFLTLPLRIITGVYYDILLFSAVSFADNMQEFLKPKRGKIGHMKGAKFVLVYTLTLPIRFAVLIIKSGLYILDSFLMFGVSVVFPTLTMQHGTDFRSAGTKITQSGDWKVGRGNYAGTGIYFGLNKQTAEHYAPNGEDMSIIIARVTLTFMKTIATLKEEERNLVGLGDSGEELAKRVKGFYSSIEHWRGTGWWEYCILKPGKQGEYVSSWRIRPVALINNGSIVRTYGGFSHYSLSGGLISGVFSWVAILSVAYFILI